MAISGAPIHRFGGSWTDQKLALVSSYLPSYVTALKNQRFLLAYLEQFHGLG